MLSAWALRRFLIRQPHPTSIRIVRDGEVEEVTRSSKWSKTAETLHALEPDLIELLDGSGALLRAIKPNDEQDASESAPEPPAVIQNDPNAALLTHFANLLHRAYEHSTTVAFAKMVELVERIDSRSDSIEARLERTETAYRRVVSQQIDDAYERVDELIEQSELTPQQQLDLNGLLRVFLSGAGKAQAEKAAPTNGKGRA